FGQPLTQGAAAIVLSHGPNRLGGTGQDGTVYAAPPGGTDEALNGPAIGAVTPGARPSTNPFIIRPPLDGSSAGCSDGGGTTLCYFDDQATYLGVNALIARMVQAGLRLR
ncbi:MAG: hypothetical protein JNM90_02870, partial [Burkholderiales bacterium]|nr:hypothetical protein [Burkholderiales bacterium]